eukprot:6661809-Ditylum_brightwellii.AAC.1
MMWDEVKCGWIARERVLIIEDLVKMDTKDLGFLFVSLLHPDGAESFKYGIVEGCFMWCWGIRVIQGAMECFIDVLLELLLHVLCMKHVAVNNEG